MDTYFIFISLTTVMSMFLKVMLLDWYPTQVMTEMFLSIRRAAKKSIMFSLMVLLTIIVLSSGASFIYDTNDNFIPLYSSVNTIGTLLIGEVDNFQPMSNDPFLDDCIFVCYSFLVVLVFSEFYVEFLM